VPTRTHGFADLERVVVDDGDLVAAGLRADRFGVWRRHGGHWTDVESFGGFAAGSTGARFVSGLVARAGDLVAVVSDGARYRLWSDTGSGRWRQVVAPAHPPTNGDTQVTVASDGDTVLLLSDDGASGHVWLTGWAAFSG
jgi:hypothetical protein